MRSEAARPAAVSWFADLIVAAAESVSTASERVNKEKDFSFGDGDFRERKIPEMIDRWSGNALTGRTRTPSPQSEVRREIADRVRVELERSVDEG